MRTTDNLASSIENGYFLSLVVMRKGQDNLRDKFLKPGRAKSLSLFHFILQKIAKQGCDLSYIGKLERSEKFPNLKMIFKIAEALEIPAKALFEFE